MYNMIIIEHAAVMYMRLVDAVLPPTLIIEMPSTPCQCQPPTRQTGVWSPPRPPTKPHNVRHRFITTTTVVRRGSQHLSSVQSYFWWTGEYPSIVRSFSVAYPRCTWCEDLVRGITSRTGHQFIRSMFGLSCY